MILEDKYVKEVCKMGQGEKCCRYLLLDKKGFQCGKFTEFARELDKRVLEHSMSARGDNCKGFKNE